MYAKLLPTVFGILMIIGAIANWDYFLQFRQLRWVERLLGRTVQRVVIATLGASVIGSTWAFM